ncbi:MAG: hypothetical protein JSS65_04645 [Armatimonadetes bacterium]|nr:hypothetical protein [Armatimonadota bacterium]
MTSAIFLLLAAQASIDIKVEGEGYFRFAREGRPVYAKSARLVVAQGRLASSSGPYLVPETLVPGSPDGLRVSLAGDVYAHYSKGETLVGRIVLVQFGDDVRPVESSGFLLCSGKGEIGEAGQGLFGVVRTVTKAEEKPATAKADEIKIYDEETEPVVQVTRTHPQGNPVMASGKVKVSLADRAQVDGETVLLGEVATVSANADLAPQLSALEVGITPPIGMTGTVTRASIERALAKAGVDPKLLTVDGPSLIRVSRSYQEIDQSSFVEAAISQSKNRLGSNTKPAYDARHPEPLKAPKGEVEFEVENIEVIGTTAACRVAVKVDGQRINSRDVKLKVDAVAPAATPKLRPGDLVVVRVRKNGLTVETKGKVRTIDNASGRVTVETTDTKAQIIGHVLPDGTVEVNP